ncbi:MAG: superoxide dismutase [Flavobacteriaceae bacterium]|nr:superoxide dismutase [Flavobacteriaceae bacterium]
MSFKLPKLSYSYHALEPHFDAKTMEVHHTKHHAGYTANLNMAIENTELADQSIEEILAQLDLENKALRNNAGGYYNHNLFWEILGPPSDLEKAPKGEFLEAINASFKSFDAFKSEFSKTSASVFGSGWAWLCSSKDCSLCICSTANQDNPLMPGIGCNCTPILGLDVWEHAYYLNYQNRRPDYIAAFFNVVDWGKVEKRYQQIIS